MLDNFINFIKTHNLISKNDKLVVGVSGGVDSMILLHLLNEIKEEYNLSPIVAHVNHGFRKESDEEFDFVESICKSYGMLFEGIKLDVDKYKKDNKLSDEVAARECRYSFYKEVMDNYGYNKLVLGHHGDDLIETVIMRQINGAYDRSLIGIQIKREFNKGLLIRPLLCFSKEEIYNIANEKSIEYREDLSNDSDVYKRNRIRKYVLPHFKKENEKVHTRFLNQSLRKEEDEDFLDIFVNRFLNEHVNTDIDIKLDKDEFNKLHLAVKRRVLKNLLRRLGANNIDGNILERLEERITKNESSDYIELMKDIYVINGFDYFYLTNVYKEKEEINIDLRINKNYSDGKNYVFLDDNKLYINNQLLMNLSSEVGVVVRSIKDGDRIDTKYGVKNRVSKILSKDKVPIAYRKNARVLEVNDDIKYLFK